MDFRITFLVANFCLLLTACLGISGKLEGPVLTSYPTRTVHFSNSVGVTLDCLAEGLSPLQVRWIASDGNPVSEISGVREVLVNNSLRIFPFVSQDFVASVHHSKYRCSATNPIGTTLSPLILIRSIIDEPFDLSISTDLDEGDVIQGNAVLLKCGVKPALYSDFMKTIHWKFIDQYGHELEIVSDGKTYQISAEGSLLILAAKYQQLFMCVAQNTLNNKIQSSSPFMLKSRAGVEKVPPTSVGKWQRMIFTEIGTNIDLLCLSMGNPPPTYRWEKLVGDKYVPVISSEPKGRIWGPLLSFEGVTASQNGTYKCEIMTSLLSTSSFELDLIVQSVPKVELVPHRRMVRTGQNVELKCEIPGVANHAEITTWWHNGKRLGGDDGGASRIRISSQRLSILNIRYEDQGVWQCFVQMGLAHVGSSSNLLFPMSDPELLHTFISQTLQPGQPLLAKCSAIGNPLPSLAFYKNGKMLSPAEEQSWDGANPRYSLATYVQMNEVVAHLNISGIRVEDSGEISCVAKNALSTAMHSARINVYGKLFVKDMDQVTLVAGSVASIPCWYGGYPVDRISWKHNGSEIDTRRENGRFRVLPNGTLQIDNIQPNRDKGTFQCAVSNRKGEVAVGSVSVNVLRPPIVTPFKFDEHLQEGQRTSVSCNVMSGDLPIDITWLKDGQPISRYLNVTQMLVKFLSTLIFEELKAVHNGNYTCRASNLAKAETYSALLKVKVPPTWLNEPMDTQALLKSDLRVPCHASGEPEPRIHWYRENSIGRTAIRPDHKFRVLENGSLLIHNLETKDEGKYVCEASQIPFSPLQKSIQISVIIPAEVRAIHSTVVVAEGLPAVLQCQVKGDEPMQVAWKKNSVVVEQSSRFLLQTVLDANSSTQVAELRIYGSERADSGNFVCLAANVYGRDEDSISLQVRARPNTPSTPIVTELSSRWIQLNWTLDAESLSPDPVTHFVLQYKNSSTISWSSAAEIANITVPAPAKSAVLRSLSPVTNYEIRILALNEIGTSLPSQPISVSTLAEAPSGPPLNVSVISTSSRALLVSWEPPLPSLQNGAILGYHVIISLAASYDVGKVIDEKWDHQAEVNELKPNSRYRVAVRAYNIAGIGPESPFIFISTPEGAPESPPLNVACEALSPKSLQVLWEPPPSHLANGAIQGYKVIYSSVSAELQGEKPEVKKTINKETTLHGLHSYTNYSVRVLAYTNGGESPKSAAVVCLTDEDLPEEPADIKVFQNMSNSAVVSWLPPHFPNGVVLKYRVSWKSDEVERVKEKYYMVIGNGNRDQMLMEVRGLKENRRYTFWVTAATSLGLGRSSQMVELTVFSKAPPKIASFPVLRRPRLEESVSLPCVGVGYPLHPEITWLRPSSPRPVSHVMSNGTLFIPRVKDQDEGIWTCRATTGEAVDEILHTISISRPPSPVSLMLGYVTSNSIQIHWDPPARQDPQLTGYLLQFKSGSSLDWSSQRLGPRLTTFAMDGLLCGTSYQIRLAPENMIGLGEFSSTLKTKTNGNPPDVPKLTEIIDGNGTMIRVDLSRWPDGGCRIKNFQLEFKNKDSNDWNTVHRNNSSRIFILNTTLGSKYEFRINLENEAGVVRKTFAVESSPQFFTNYDKLMQRGGEATVMSGIAMLSDPHVIVPIISAIICTAAVIICILIVIKRKTGPGEGWKLGNSSSQQTWLSSEDFRVVEKSSDKQKEEEIPGNSGMSIYATLNSRKAIPMTIRDSTVRFHTFGQIDNFDAPPPQSCSYGRGRTGSFPRDELEVQDGFVKYPRDSLNLREIQSFRRISHPNEYAIEDTSHDYAHPYQVVPVHKGPTDFDIYGRNTLRKHGKKPSRGHRD